MCFQALGDYTRMISDFSVLPTELREGRVGSYWYHEDTQAFFDDVDHYKMIKAMCRLSCSVCDNMEGPNDGSKRRARFRNIEQLKGHLFHRHKLLMCSLCLEGRKVRFICLASCSWNFFFFFGVCPTEVLEIYLFCVIFPRNSPQNWCHLAPCLLS